MNLFEFDELVLRIIFKHLSAIDCFQLLSAHFDYGKRKYKHYARFWKKIHKRRRIEYAHMKLCYKYDNKNMFRFFTYIYANFVDNIGYSCVMYMCGKYNSYNLIRYLNREYYYTIFRRKLEKNNGIFELDMLRRALKFKNFKLSEYIANKMMINKYGCFIYNGVKYEHHVIIKSSFLGNIKIRYIDKSYKTPKTFKIYSDSHDNKEWRNIKNPKIIENRCSHNNSWSNYYSWSHYYSWQNNNIGFRPGVRIISGQGGTEESL